MHEYLLSRITPELDNLPDALTHGKAVDATADVLQAICAEVIAYLIDAGSERDAVNESEALHNALIDELVGWADALDHDNAPDDQAHHNH